MRRAWSGLTKSSSNNSTPRSSLSSGALDARFRKAVLSEVPARLAFRPEFASVVIRPNTSSIPRPKLANVPDEYLSDSPKSTRSSVPSRAAVINLDANSAERLASTPNVLIAFDRIVVEVVRSI